MASLHLSGPVSWNTRGLPSRSLKLALMPGRCAVPVILAWPVTGLRWAHIVVVSVQPMSRICPPSSERSTFWPMPVVRAWVSAASAPPKARIAQVSSATDTTPVRIFWPGMA